MERGKKRLFSSSEKATERAIQPSSGKYSEDRKTRREDRKCFSHFCSQKRAAWGQSLRQAGGAGRTPQSPAAGRKAGLQLHTARDWSLACLARLGSTSQLILCSAEASFGESGYNSKSFHCTDCMPKDWERLGFAFHAFLKFSYFLQCTCYFIISKNNKYYFK